MNPYVQPILFFLFVISGFCGLLYQVVWLRLAFAAFGIVTPVLSVVISIFMLGLALGSWVGGYAARTLSSSTRSPLWLYGAAEAFIGAGAFILPWLFGVGETFLLSFGDMDSGSYLAVSAVLICISILPWCLCMGLTYPAALAYLKRQMPGNATGFSFLYLANVIGAMAGALLTAIVLVEWLGFSATLRFAAALNGVIALVGFVLASKDRSAPLPFASSPGTFGRRAASMNERPGLKILFLTGFASMAMEVVWTRAFTPALRTTIYAFALLLTTYLLATWVGSAWYRRHLLRGRVFDRDRMMHWLAFTACLPLVINDPRLYLRGVGALLSIFPFCTLLGYLTPMLIDQHSAGEPRRAGSAYAINITGCILGPLVAGYLLLPFLGAKWSLVALALPFFAWTLETFRRDGFKQRQPAWAALVPLMLGIFFARTYEEQALSQNAVVRRDHTATVISASENQVKQMFVNGISITLLTPITKLMAHIPLAALPKTPHRALVICFGMGTTFRSLLSWDIDTWAAELVPSARDAFGYYFPDGPRLLAQPNAHVVVDDGRRFLRRTGEKFDVITLDPPPPIEAAGSSLLYSTEFYQDAKSRLNPGGILQQWFPGGEPKILQAVARSLSHSFPHVRVFRSTEGWGYHLLASQEPLRGLDAEAMLGRMPATARVDLVEWYPGRTARDVLEDFLKREVPLESVLGPPEWFITDDRPLNEYYLMRRFSARG